MEEKILNSITRKHSLSGDCKKVVESALKWILRQRMTEKDKINLLFYLLCDVGVTFLEVKNAFGEAKLPQN